MKAKAAPLVCGNGSKWTRYGCGPCLKCRQEAARMSQGHAVEMLMGLYDLRGYTPAEKRALL